MRIVLPLCASALLLGCAAAPLCGNAELDRAEVCDEGAANGSYGHCRADCSAMPTLVSVDGDLLPFGGEIGRPRVANAKVSVLEHPELVFTTGADAHFTFENLEAGSDFTLVVEHPDFKPTQTATVTLGSKGIHPFPVQMVSIELFDLLAAFLPQGPQESRFCAIATTTARLGGGLYVALRQGMPGVQVSLTPAARPESGPVYFNELVMPDRTRTSTSIDGGVLFYRVPPGDYVMRATRDGTVFSETRFRCRAGVVVNAGPPMGVLAHVKAPDFGLGFERPADADSAVTDALCEATAACSRRGTQSDDYPAATVAGCKAHFRNMWAFLDEPCARESGVREAAKATYACRAASCSQTLGADKCPMEEAAFRAAEDAYGACVAAK